MRVMIELRRYEMQPVLSTGFGSARCVRLYSRVRRHWTFFGSVFDFILLEFWSLRDAKCGLFAFKSPLGSVDSYLIHRTIAAMVTTAR